LEILADGLAENDTDFEADGLAEILAEIDGLSEALGL